MLCVWKCLAPKAKPCFVHSRFLLSKKQRKQQGFKDLKHKGTRQGCHCIESRDIGAYDTCLNACKYCYANKSPRKALENYQYHDPDSLLLLGNVQPDDIIIQGLQKSFLKLPRNVWNDYQSNLIIKYLGTINLWIYIKGLIIQVCFAKFRPMALQRARKYSIIFFCKRPIEELWQVIDSK